MVPEQQVGTTIKQLAVMLGTDQLDKFARATAIQAIEELIWNGYVADAKSITVTLVALGSVSRLEIVDDGCGIPFDQLDKTFAMIGDSVKRAMRKTPGGRNPRGRCGRGRFKAFALANIVKWISRYSEAGSTRQYTIHGDKSRPQPF